MVRRFVFYRHENCVKKTNRRERNTPAKVKIKRLRVKGQVEPNLRCKDME